MLQLKYLETPTDVSAWVPLWRVLSLGVGKNLDFEFSRIGGEVPGEEALAWPGEPGKDMDM